MPRESPPTPESSNPIAQLSREVLDQLRILDTDGEFKGLLPILEALERKDADISISQEVIDGLKELVDRCSQGRSVIEMTLGSNAQKLLEFLTAPAFGIAN